MNNTFKGAHLIIKGDEELGGVYLGNFRVVSDQKELEENNIKAVVSVISNKNVSFKEGI